MSRLIGQRSAETLLARALARDRVGHAYLFLGPQGVGKATAAGLFAQALNCRTQPAVRPSDAPGADWSRLAPCGECDNCRRVAAGTHPEVLEVHPGSKTGQDITVEQAREIRTNAALRPKLGRRRVYLLPKAEALNEVSANALLKTLEEPSESVTLILCAPSPNLVLPTILSRCQTVRFGLAPAAEIAAALTAVGSTPETAAALAHASGGRPGLALAWADQPGVLAARRQVLDTFARAVLARQECGHDPSAGALCFRLAEQLRSLVGKERDGDGPPAKVLHSRNVEIGLTCLRDLLLLTQGASPELAQNQDRVAELTGLARTLDPAEAMDAVHAAREAQQLLDRNVPPQLVFERMFWAMIAGSLPPVTTRLFEGSRA